MPESSPVPPSNLGPAGRALWDQNAREAAAEGHLPALLDACLAADTDTPAGLGPQGIELWAALTSAYDLAPRERTLLVAACRQADAIAAMEDAVTRDGLAVLGAAGQPRLNAAVAEARQGRLALSRLLGALALPDAVDRPETEATRRARHAATVRWSNVRRLHSADGRPA